MQSYQAAMFVHTQILHVQKTLWSLLKLIFLAAYRCIKKKKIIDHEDCFDF